jgi:hypothetical protein
MSSEGFHDSDLGRYEFAIERSHKDAQVSNEHSRATAQALILINGGAATAVLAYLSKDKLDSSVLTFASLSLGAYCVGVLFGAGMLYCMTRTLDYFGYYWHVREHPDEGDAKLAHEKAKRWLRWVDACFVGAALFFLYGTVIIGCTLGTSRSPQQTTSSIAR